MAINKTLKAYQAYRRIHTGVSFEEFKRVYKQALTDKKFRKEINRKLKGPKPASSTPGKKANGLTFVNY